MAFLKMVVAGGGEGRRKRNILVIYGAISLDFVLELMTCIYHLKNATFRELLAGGFFPLSSSLLDWSGPLCCGKISRPYIYLSPLNLTVAVGEAALWKKRSGGGIVA